LNWRTRPSTSIPRRFSPFPALDPLPACLI
jgi:hypothetical protein